MEEGTISNKGISGNGIHGDEGKRVGKGSPGEVWAHSSLIRAKDGWKPKSTPEVTRESLSFWEELNESCKGS